MRFPGLVLLSLFDFPRTESIWQRDPLGKHRSMMRGLVQKLGSVFSQCTLANGTSVSDTVIVPQRPGQ